MGTMAFYRQILTPFLHPGLEQDENAVGDRFQTGLLFLGGVFGARPYHSRLFLRAEP